MDSAPEVGPAMRALCEALGHKDWASMQAAAEGRLREIFGCGTACIVQPINGLVRADGETLEAPFDASNITSMTARMTRALTDIQYAR